MRTGPVCRANAKNKERNLGWFWKMSILVAFELGNLLARYFPWSGVRFW
jgi:hypothetical protein